MSASEIRWTVQRKLQLLDRIESGELDLEDARAEYAASEEEVRSWRDRLDRFGAVGLRPRALQKVGR